MVKLTMVSATLVVLVVVVLAMAEASSAFRTIIIEEEVGGMNRRREEDSCKKQMMKQQTLSHCQMYLSKKMQDGSLMMNPGRGEEEEYMRDMCCGQLKSMDERCRCDALEFAVIMQLQSEQTGSPEMVQKIFGEAEKMYSKCNLSPTTCHMPTGA